MFLELVCPWHIRIIMCIIWEVGVYGSVIIWLSCAFISPLSLSPLHCLCVYAHVCVCTHAHMCMCVCAHVCGGQKSALGIFLNHLPLYFFWDKVSLWTWSSPIQLDCLSSKSQASSCLCFPGLGLQRCTTVPGFLHGCSDSEPKSSSLYNKYFTNWAISLALPTPNPF